MRITSCKINHLTNPLGYWLDRCVFSWTVEEAQGKKPDASRIVVKTDNRIIVDTGWANLDNIATQLDVFLIPQTRYTWTVSVRTDVGEEATSAENWFETGLERWSARWIGCDNTISRHPIFTKSICPEKSVASARLYICGLGLYEARWNGEKIGLEYLTPYCNNYNAWVQYQTYDITKLLQMPGQLAIELGNGWYNERFGIRKHPKPYYSDGWKLIAQISMTYTDGTTEQICTDESWKVTRSSIFCSNIYDGEYRDDTLPAMDPVSAVYVTPPKGTLKARCSTPVMVRQEMPVREVLHTPAGETVLDMGQNMTGTFRFTVRAPEGARIHLQFGEILQNGNFYRENLRSAKAEYVYISDGKPHILEPKFTFYGYRYVKVCGVPDVKAADFTGLLLYSELKRTGYLETGNPQVNQLISNIEWGQIDNFLDVPTDCPQRDERMGWTGDAQVFAPTACYQRDSYAFFAKYLRDLWSEQRDNQGAVPDVVPSFGKNTCSSAWGDAACIIPWTLYRFYGDKSILEDQYPSMRAWVDYITALDGMDNGWRNHYHYGDWLALDSPREDYLHGGTDLGFVASTQYRYCAILTAQAAHVLGKKQDAEKYEKLAERILSEIRREYFTATGRCAVPTQTGQLLTVRYGLGTDPARSVTDLVDRLHLDANKLKTGFVGTPLLCPVLTQTGHADMAFELLLNEEYPGWLYEVKMGATTVWERWNSVDENGIIADNGMNSLNHYAYGSIAQWLYEDVAGIAPLEPGFRKARLAPHMHPELKQLRARMESAAGTWDIFWKIQKNGDIFYRCVIPFGCTAELELPYGGGVHNLETGSFETTYSPNEGLC